MKEIEMHHSVYNDFDESNYYKDEINLDPAYEYINK